MTGDYLVGQFSSLVNKMGSEEYIGCVFDGEQAYENAGEKLQEMFPWSIHLTCFAHSLHLIPKDRSICTSSFKEVFATAHKMISLCNQSMRGNVGQNCTCILPQARGSQDGSIGAMISSDPDRFCSQSFILCACKPFYYSISD